MPLRLAIASLPLLRSLRSATSGSCSTGATVVSAVGSSVVVILISIQGTVQFYPNLFMPTLIFLLNLGIQQLMGNFIEPRVQGSNLNLSPVLILISLAFMAWMWGAVGAVLAVPITVMLRVVFGYFDSTRFLSILMSTGYSKKK